MSKNVEKVYGHHYNDYEGEVIEAIDELNKDKKKEQPHVEYEADYLEEYNEENWEEYKEEQWEKCAKNNWDKYFKEYLGDTPKNREGIIVGEDGISNCFLGYDHVTHGQEEYSVVTSLMEYEDKIYIVKGERQTIYTGDEGGRYSLGASYSRFYDINEILEKFNIPSIYSESEVSVDFVEFDDVKLINEDGTLSEAASEVYEKVCGLKEIKVYTNAEEFIEINEDEGTSTLNERIVNDENKEYFIEKSWDNQVEITAGNINNGKIHARIKEEGDKILIAAYGKLFDYGKMEKAREAKEEELARYIDEEAEIDEILAKIDTLNMIKDNKTTDK